MLNQVVLVGKIDNIDFEKEQLILSVNKNYKNSDGVYESILVPCLIEGDLVNTTREYYNKDDLVGVKGSLDIIDDKLYVLAKRITMLKSNSE